jgi:4-hydroxybenzoate polyprenyltransferase
VKGLGINSDNKSEYVVVGDKFLTDGLLALQLGLPFYHVKTLMHEKEKFLNKVISAIDDFAGNAYEFLKLIRPKQWVKNLLVISPVFFATQVTNLPVLASALLAFLAFTIVSAFVYIVNDYSDIENDKLHPKKRYRPLAMGNLEQNYLLLFSFILLCVLIFILQFIPNTTPWLLGYLFLNLLYTFKFKHIPVYDIVIVGFLYLLRIVVGGVATSIVLSPWIITCMFFAALFITSMKRLGELANPTRKVLKYYTRESLAAIFSISAALSLISYTMYTILAVKNEYGIYSSVIATAIFLLAIHDTLTSNKKTESPEIYLLTNKKTVFLIVIWLLFEIAILYLV